MCSFFLRLSPVVALLFALPAWGEATGLFGASPSSGLGIPGTSVALEDGPAAGVVNPAGVAMQRGLALRYLHEEGVGEDISSLDGDGLYLGTPLFGFLGFGLSFEWLSPDSDLVGDHRRTTWSLALGDDRISLGASAHVFTHGFLDDHTTWDAGLLLRPSRHLSLGFVIRDLDATRFAGTRLPRRYAVGIGLRPVGDWLTVAADGEVLGAENEDIAHGFDSAVLGYTARVRPTSGVTLFGGYSHQLDGGTDFIHVGLRLDHDHLGIEGAPLVRTTGGDVGWVAGAELRTYSEGRVRPPPGAHVAHVRLNEALSGSQGIQVFPGPSRDPLTDVVEGLAALGRDDSVDAILLELRGSLPLGLGTAWDVRQALLDLRAKGKTVVVYLVGGNDAAYQIAAAADHIIASPTGAFFINGFQSRADFYKDTLEWAGIQMEAIRIGAYKTAPESLTSDEISEAQREVMNSLLDDSFRGYVSTLAKDRGMDEGDLRDLLQVGIRSPSSALDAGLVDAIAYEDELRSQMETWLGGRVRLMRHELEPAAWTHWSAPPTIAVIPIEGTIVSGEAEGFGFVPTTGARTVVRSLNAAAADPAVEAILLRIDSGGGDAGASEEIWRAASEARRRKPVIVAMGNAAASGGYYAAVGGDRIFAAPGTITGSIGIFWLKPDLSGLMEKLRVGTYETSRGEQAGILSSRKAWTAAEEASIQTYLDTFYSQFVDAVADARELSWDEVDSVGQGRVWTGSQALDAGLVDDLGGLPAALRAVRVAAGLQPDELVQFRVYAPSRALFSSGGVSALAASPLDGPVQGLLREVVPIPILLWNGSGLWTLAPHAWRPQ